LFAVLLVFPLQKTAGEYCPLKQTDVDCKVPANCAASFPEANEMAAGPLAL
jgi:hypothetical protein